MTYFQDCTLTNLSKFIAQDCPEEKGQVLGVVFQLKRPFASNKFTALNPITAEASWDTFIAATDATTAVPTPPAKEMTIPASAGNFTGGNDNTTVLGKREYNGEDNIFDIPFKIDQLNNASRQTLDSFTGFSTLPLTNLMAYFICEGGIYAKAGSTAGEYTGFDIDNFRVPSETINGFNSRNMIEPTFDLPAKWNVGGTLIANSDLDFIPQNKLFSLTA